jgi:hypothetical protein
VSTPDVWLRGPIEGVDAELQPAAHALVQALEDVERATAGLSEDNLWRRPGSAASAGFHLKHLSGATDRLLSYARGEGLTEDQRAWLATEATDGEPVGGVAPLVARFRSIVEAGLVQLRATPPAALAEPRAIGRAKLPTTVLGCLVHAAEHASRHAGQLITTLKAVGS